jgi:hypothetical protein
MTFGQMTFGKMTFGQMTFGQMTFGQMTFGQNDEVSLLSHHFIFFVAFALSK